MGVEKNPNPLEELARLDQQVDLATDLESLKPIFYRVDEIAKRNPSDFDVQLMVGDVKQRLIQRGTRLKHQAPALPPKPPTPNPLASKPMSGRPPDGSPASAIRSEGSLTTTEQARPVERPLPIPPPRVGQEPPRPPLGRAEPPPVARRQIPPRPPPEQKPVPPPRYPANWKRALALGAIAGSILSIALLALLINQARKRNLPKDVAATAGLQVQVTTTPPGAAVRITSVQPGAGEAQCTSACQVALTPGAYSVTAFLNGYEPSASNLNVVAGQPAAINLTLAPAAQTVRILTDLDQGKVALDGQPPADLQEGQFVVDKIAPGLHTVKVTGKSGDASFSFEVADAKLPVVSGPVTTHNLMAVLMSTLGNQGRVVTSSGPAKLVLNGQPQGDATPAGTDLTNFQAGVNEIVVGEGKDQRNMKESFGPAPALTVFLKSDINSGTLIVSTGEDDVHVFLNGKEYRRRTQRGQIRIPALGQVAVRVAKNGFQEEPPQTADVKKGAEVRLEFKLKPLPQVAMLQIRGATPGAEVLLDQKSIGTVGADGSFAFITVPPGDRVVELRHDQDLPKRLQRSFKAGAAVVLTGADVVLLASNGTIKLERNPAGATVTYRRADESEAHEVTTNQLELPSGNYVFSAKAPGFTDRTERVQIAAGETRTVQIALARARIPAAPPAAVVGIGDFEDSSAWKKEGELWVHRGGGFIPYKLPSKGVFEFTVELLKGGNVFRGGRIRWAVQYVDSKNYLLFELDKKNFWAEVVEKGKKFERAKTQHDLEKQKAFTIQIDSSADRLMTKVRNGEEWIVLDSFSEPGRDFTQGKFAFLIQGNDEIGISGFKFTPKP